MNPKYILDIGNFAIGHLYKNKMFIGTFPDGMGYRFALVAAILHTPCRYLTAIGNEPLWQKALAPLAKNNCKPKHLIKCNASLEFDWLYDSHNLSPRIKIRNSSVMQKIALSTPPIKPIDTKAVFLGSLGLEYEKIILSQIAPSIPVAYVFHETNLKNASATAYLNLFKKINYLFLNENEASLLIPKTSYLQAGAVLSKLSQAVFLTRGARGVAVFQHGTLYKKFPAISTSVVDPSGAGDIFASTTSIGLFTHDNIDLAVISGLTFASIKLGGYLTTSLQKFID